MACDSGKNHPIGQLGSNWQTGMLPGGWQTEQ
jgi:hypothetical protein